MLSSAYDSIAASFDTTHGGFGGAPKFPQQPVLEFLLRTHDQEWAPDASAMLSRTLEEMASGGIHDQLGGGFARYSVDDAWLVPHFEKMLYDNAQLARLYLWAGIELERDDLISVARSTLDYMVRDLRHPKGGFFSSEDADSEGVEGKFYVWTPEEIRGVLGDDADQVLEFYGVTEHGNFEGSNILSVVGDMAPPRIDTSRRALLEARARRVRPGLDDKIVSSWNGLAIRAFAEAGAVLTDDRYLDIAETAASFSTEHLIVDGRLMRSWREGRVSVPGFLEDVASLAVSLFTLYSVTGDTSWYEAAMDHVIRLDAFEREGGGFYQTASDATGLLKRPTDLADNPLPSGNALASEALLLASSLSGDGHLRDRADHALEAAGAIASRFPSMVGHHLAVALSSQGPRELAIVGNGWRDLAQVYWRRYRPDIVLAASEKATDAVPLLAGRDTDVTTAFVCRGFVCDLPTTDPAELESQLA